MSSDSKKRGQSEPPRQNSRSPRSRKDAQESQVPDDDFDRESEPSSIQAWCDAPPTLGCTTDELRWYVIREIGQVKRNMANATKVSNRQGIDLDILKAKTREKMDGDRVDARITKALEHVPTSWT